uniref:Symplekin/Pta1 N-terminal domain-containing protein n=1 Tax=Plectus sambesii TaxID=2011161 RepID=A0A914WJ65_9BILA
MTEAQESVGDLVASEIQEAQAINNGTSDQRLDHLRRAQELIIHHDPSGSLLDNFLDEMLEFMIDSDAKIRCFVVGFILEACKKEMELIKKMGSNLLFMLSDQSQNVSVTKKVINVATLLYPLLLSWMSKQKNPDQETELAWENFAVLKGRVLHQIESENEGIRTQTFKFLESCILAQTPKTAQSEGSKADSMSLDQVPRDHRFISYRKLDLEAKQYIDSLLQQLSAAHISSLNLLTVISCLTNIARQRPEYMEKVLLAFETLHVNLPPTLGTSQVKSVRKELKMHLLRLLKHEASSPFHPQITTLLTDLGASQQEVLRALPSDSELKRRMRRPGESADVGAPQRKRAKAKEASTSQVVVEADDDQEDDDASAADSETKRTQSAIDITGQYLYDKLTAKNVADLVLVSMAMLPDEMPPNFQSSYTPIAAAGTEAQIRHLSRMMATQFTAQGVGPGVEQGKREAREKYLERQSAKMEGAVMPPTPAHISASSGESSMAPPPPPPAKPPGPLYGVQGQQKASKRLIQFGLAHITRPMQPEERSRMIQFAFEHIINSEKRALQGGGATAHQKLMVRLACRFAPGPLTSSFEDLLLTFIMADQKSRSDLAILWVYETYAQFQGFTQLATAAEEQDRYDRYGRCLCRLLETLFERGEHKETLFHKILLEAPHITPDALLCLKRACLDKVYGAFGMTTLREMILTRPRQRSELLCVLLDFSYYERPDLKTQSLETAKELFQLDWIRPDVKEFVGTLLENVLRPQPPPVLFGEEQGRPVRMMVWDEHTIRACLYLYLNLLPLDHSLIQKLAEVYALANTEVKKVIFRVLEAP